VQVGRIVRLTTAGTLSLTLFFASELAASAQVAVTVDGNEADFSPPPTIQAGRVFVPLRGVFERLGASVVYSNGTINATGHGRTISLQIGSTQATIDGQPQSLDVAPYIVGASTYVPLRFISQALGASVQWDENDRMVSIESSGGQPYNSQANDSESDYAPPPNPDYQQPYVAAPNDIWQPGYWAWGQYGYYWVPGTWVAPPQQGYLWTPGYWQDNSGNGGDRFAFVAGYWAKLVGFYGGVNYGGGYNGNGYDGARWSGNNVTYNTSVTRVNPANNYSTYADRNEAGTMSASRVSYNGGAHGVGVRPTAAQLAVAKAPHLGPTAVQRQHVMTAASDRRQLAKVNDNRPPLLVSAKPLSASNRPAGLVPVKATDVVAKPASKTVIHAAAVKGAPVAHPAAVVHAAPVAHPAAVVHAAPVAHPAAVVHAAPAAHPAAVVHAAPVAHPAAVVHAAAEHRAAAEPAKPAKPVKPEKPAADTGTPKDAVHPTPKAPVPQ
jgi:hypothetical protein